MSRVVTASEVDRLHAQVAELTERVKKLEGPSIAELFEGSVQRELPPTVEHRDPPLSNLDMAEALALSQR